MSESALHILVSPCRWVLVALGLVGLVLLLTKPARAQQAALTERELQAQADLATNQQDYGAAVAALETIVERFPDNKNEQVFWDLGKFCDTYGHDFEKAVKAYRTYLERFPKGRFAPRFRDRLAYLEAHRQDWEPLKNFIAIQANLNNRPAEENIAKVEKLLADHPNTTVRPDLHNWLAGQYVKLKQYGPAKVHSDQYLASFPANGKPRAAHVQALDLAAKIARKQRNYGEALEKLQQIAVVDPTRVQEFQESRQKVLVERRCWWVFLVSLGYAAVALVAGLGFRPWKGKEFVFQPKRLLLMLGLVVASTAGPFGVLKAIGEKTPNTFWALAGFGSAALVLLWLCWPLAARIGKKLFLVLSLLLLASAVYCSFYVTEVVEIFWWPIDELKRHS